VLAKSPVALIAYDLLELDGVDVRGKPLTERRMQLERIINNTGHSNLIISGQLHFQSWDEAKVVRLKSREKLAEGLMVKRKESPYQVGRKRGDWWKWKVDPLSIDAVMIYAMRGHGRRANLFSDYTFAVWDGPELVPFAKAYSGLTDKEMGEVDRFVKKHTIERFGPVRSVVPELVFEIGFEGIAYSPRHKSGIALRFPRILRWRRDKPPSEANTLDDLKAILVDMS
jgi:DNA ligase-1